MPSVVAVRSIAVLILLTPAGSLAGQSIETDRDRQITISAGTLGWDARGTGHSYTLAARASRSLGARWMAAELGLAYAALDEQFQTAPTHVAALDVQLQLQGSWSRFQPYVGVGPGIFTYLTRAGGRDRVEMAYSTGVGLRVRIRPTFSIVTDARLRGWDFENAQDFTVNMAGEVTVGLSYRY